MHWVILAIAGPLQGEEYLLESALEIGRSGDLAIQLIAPSVSRRHAALRLDQDGTVELADLESRNGTYVRGERVNRCHLVSGDTFEVGSSSFRIEQRVGDPETTADDIQLNLLSGPAEDITAIFDRRGAVLSKAPQTVRPTTLPRAAGLSDRCEDPLHQEAIRRGWRFCPVCGLEPELESSDDSAPVPSTEPSTA